MSTDLRPPRYKVKLRLQKDILPHAKELPLDDCFFIRLVFDKCIKSYVYNSDQHGWQFYDNLHDEMNYVSVRVEPALLLQEDSARVSLWSMFRRVNIPWRDELIQEISKIHRFLVSTERDFREKPQGPKHMPIAIDIKLEIYRAIPLEEDELAAQISSLSMDDYVVKITPASKEAIEALEKVKIDEGLHVGEICAVCYEEFLVGLEGIRLPCTHLYHRDCILQWLARSFVCPLCRFEMPIAPRDD